MVVLVRAQELRIGGRIGDREGGEERSGSLTGQWSLVTAQPSGFSSGSGVNPPAVRDLAMLQGSALGKSFHAPMLPCRVGVDFLLPFLPVTPAHASSCP